MPFLLDTNVCIRLINRTSPRAMKRLRESDPSAIRLSIVTRAELLFGARNSARIDANLAIADQFCAPYPVLVLDEACARHYAIVRADLTQRGTPIGSNDYLIAATALAHDLTLVTHNTREFSRVVGLRVEDWER